MRTVNLSRRCIECWIVSINHFVSENRAEREKKTENERQLEKFSLTLSLLAIYTETHLQTLIHPHTWYSGHCQWTDLNKKQKKNIKIRTTWIGANKFKKRHFFLGKWYKLSKEVRSAFYSTPPLHPLLPPIDAGNRKKTERESEISFDISEQKMFGKEMSGCLVSQV